MFLAAYALSLRHCQPHQAAVPTVKALAVADSTHPVSPYLFVNTVKAFVGLSLSPICDLPLRPIQGRRP